MRIRRELNRRDKLRLTIQLCENHEDYDLNQLRILVKESFEASLVNCTNYVELSRLPEPVRKKLKHIISYGKNLIPLSKDSISHLCYVSRHQMDTSLKYLDQFEKGEIDGLQYAKTLKAKYETLSSDRQPKTSAAEAKRMQRDKENAGRHVIRLVKTSELTYSEAEAKCRKKRKVQLK